ncbi:Co-chaperonin GroES [uncultured Mediterranean phage]|nr:Co-chaperonin GroES [uncultured Mediterranean phage]
MNFEPIGWTLLVKLEERSKETPGGIVLPENKAQRKDIQIGKVVARGRGKITEYGDFIENPIQNGARVAVRSRCGTEVTLENEKLYLVQYEELAGVFGE